jgi:6-phosphogluconolactonase
VSCDEVAAAAASAFEDRVTTALARQPRFAVAVPGGSVASMVFPRLAVLPLPWSRVDLTWVDERVVPASDPESNLGAARTKWIDRLPDARPRLIAPAVDLGDPFRVAAEWQAALVAALGSPPRLDLVILGMGPDGHVASLFPGHALLDGRGAWTASLTDSPKPPAVRVTLTLDTILAAAEIWIVACGPEKAAAVADVRGNAHSRLPGAIVARQAKRLTWYLDDAAARG